MYHRRYTRHHELLTVPVWSPFMGRAVMVTPRQFRLLVVLMRHRRGWDQRTLAAESGYETPGGVSRSLHLLARLGVIALSTTRGRFGSTVAWIRRGVHAMKASGVNVAQHHRNRSEGTSIPNRRDGQHSAPSTIGDVLAGLLPRPEALP